MTCIQTTAERWKAASALRLRLHFSSMVELLPFQLIPSLQILKGYTLLCRSIGYSICAVHLPHLFIGNVYFQHRICSLKIWNLWNEELSWAFNDYPDDFLGWGIWILYVLDVFGFGFICYGSMLSEWRGSSLFSWIYLFCARHLSFLLLNSVFFFNMIHLFCSFLLSVLEYELGRLYLCHSRFLCSCDHNSLLLH